jgi:hypothetical protein
MSELTESIILDSGDLDRRRRELGLYFLYCGERDRELRGRVGKLASFMPFALLRLPSLERRERSVLSPASPTPSSLPRSIDSSVDVGAGPSLSVLRFHMSFLRHRGHRTTLTRALLRSPCSS